MGNFRWDDTSQKSILVCKKNGKIMGKIIRIKWIFLGKLAS